MRSFLLRLSCLVLITLTVAACDKCGEPVKFNAPWDGLLPKTCVSPTPR